MKLGDVLSKLKSSDVDDLVYTTSSKPVDFEHWVAITRMNLQSKHSALADWWDLMYANARRAYEHYLQLSPLHRSDIRPGLDGFDTIAMQVERYMLRHVLRAMPKHVQQTLLHMTGVTCGDIIFQALVGAGPGTDSAWAQPSGRGAKRHHRAHCQNLR